MGPFFARFKLKSAPSERALAAPRPPWPASRPILTEHHFLFIAGAGKEAHASLGEGGRLEGNEHGGEKQNEGKEKESQN